MAENQKLKKDIRRLAAAARQTSDWSDKVESSKIGQTNSGSKIDRGFVGHKAAKMMKRSKSIEDRKIQALEQKSGLLKNIETKDELVMIPRQYHTDRLCELQDVSISYGERVVCEHISFEIRRGDRIALRGRNGCGKSSILKLICGQEIAHSGQVRVGSGLVISYVSQSTDGLTGTLTDYAKQWDIDESLFKTVLRKLDFAREQFEKSMEDFSAGQKKKVLLARSLCEQAHLYVWDEPLNYIDVISRMQIEEMLLEYRPTLLFVEHDRAFCKNIATKECTW